MSAIVPSPAQARPFRLNVEEAFRFLARDREWPGKLGLGAVFSFLSPGVVGTLLVNGYLLALMERVARAALGWLLGGAAGGGLPTTVFLLCLGGISAPTSASQLFRAHMIGQLCGHGRVTRPPATTATTRAAG